MPALPSSLDLTSIGVGAQILSADHRNNYAALQTDVNAILAALNIDAKGDLLVATANDTLTNVTVGTNGYALIADSTQTAGVKWASVANTIYRKTTATSATDTVVETDLITGTDLQVAANALSTNKVARLTVVGDWKQNSGALQLLPRFKLKLGATPTTIIDTGVCANTPSLNSASRYGWKLVAEIANIAATNVQWVDFLLTISYTGSTTNPSGLAFTTGEGNYQALGSASFNGMAVAQGGNSGAIDTTAAMNVVLSVINPTATTTETTMKRATLEVI